MPTRLYSMEKVSLDRPFHLSWVAVIATLHGCLPVSKHLDNIYQRHAVNAIRPVLRMVPVVLAMVGERGAHALQALIVLR
jgi:hypothetical protein